MFAWSKQVSITVRTQHQGDQMSLLKNAQNVAQPIFAKIKLHITFSVEICRQPKSFAYFCNCQKNCPKKTIAQWTNIRPIWSPCPTQTMEMRSRQIKETKSYLLTKKIKIQVPLLIVEKS
jgi:hypothetical protein